MKRGCCKSILCISQSSYVCPTTVLAYLIRDQRLQIFVKTKKLSLKLLTYLHLQADESTRWWTKIRRTASGVLFTESTESTMGNNCLRRRSIWNGRRRYIINLKFVCSRLEVYYRVSGETQRDETPGQKCNERRMYRL
jgi:hypothetical protein